MVKPRSTSEDSVYSKIVTAIRKRYIRQGSQLVEVTLAQQLGVSRTPVRSAIKRLEAEGFVNSIPNKGAFIITPTSREIAETFQVRSELEQMAARLAAKTISARQLAVLTSFVEHEKELHLQNCLDEYDQLNSKFHLKIAEYSGNSVLSHYIKQLLNRTRIYLILFDPFLRLEFSPTIDEHQAIISALAAHDQEAAGHAVKNHLYASAHGLETADVVPEDYLAV